MKKFAVIFLCLSALFIAAAPVNENTRREQRLLQYMSAHPENPVSFGTHKLSKKKIAQLILKYHPDFEEYSLEELKDAFQHVIDEEIFYTLCADFLKKEGFAPSQQRAFQYLQKALQQFPSELKKLKYQNQTLADLASDRDTQLSIALQQYLKKKHPSEINATAEEIEYFYRVNQNVFMHDAKIDISFIAAAKSDPNAFATLKKAYNLLRQGVQFSKLAAKINEKLPKDFFKTNSFPPEMAVRAAQMQLNEPSHIIEFSNYYAIIMVTQKNPPKYIPLKKAEFFIRSELESRKSGIYLEKLLNGLLKQTEIKKASF